MSHFSSTKKDCLHFVCVLSQLLNIGCEHLLEHFSVVTSPSSPTQQQLPATEKHPKHLCISHFARMMADCKMAHLGKVKEEIKVWPDFFGASNTYCLTCK